jgi:hypothetical protein
MPFPDQPPKIPKAPFVVSDALLLLAAGLIAHFARDPFAGGPLVAIVSLVFGAAILGLYPFVADYARAQDEVLDARERSLEALARTVSSTAEQIGIAANGFHEIAELAQKNLRHADQLPHKLQEKIAEFQARLSTARDGEKEELEQELAALRSSESERLEAVIDRIARSTTEWAKLEATAQKQLAASTAALASAQAQASAAFEEKTAALQQAITTATTAALTALEAKLAALEAAAKSLPTLVAPATAAAPVVAAEASPSPATVPAPPAEETTAHPPKRPRKPRREEPAAAEPISEPVEEPAAATISEPPAFVPPESAPVESAPSEPVVASAPPVPPPAEPPAEAAVEPPPVAAENIPEIAPVMPHTAEPFPEATASVSSPVPDESPAPPAPSLPPAATDASEPTEGESTEEETLKPARKRAPKKPATEPEPMLDLGLEEPAAQGVANVERVLTSDGATRLIATAYIGIGNRLFIRGEGPGLSWEKGVPLQFVSIGKWRWETNDAVVPLSFKLYKNDEIECAALGRQSLEPGHQHEVTATF